MENNEVIKVVDYIEGYYHRKLEKNEIVVLKDELDCCKNFEDFKNRFAKVLFKRFEFFSVQKLHQLIEEEKQLAILKKQLGINTFEELYEN